MPDAPFCHCLLFSANALARRINTRAEAHYAPTGLSPTHGFVLMLVNKMPGIQPSIIGEQMVLSPSTITRLVEKLEARGLVRRETQGRVSHIHPTPEGQKMDQGVREAWAKVYADYINVLGESPARQLTASVYEAAVKLEEE